jgi:hypothetical protein
MPTTLTFPVQPDGLVVDVMIGLDAGNSQALQRLGQPIPRPVRARGVVDTATDLTAVAPAVLQALGLSSSQSAHIHTAGGLVQVKVYDISLSILPPPGSAPLLTVPQLTASELIHAAPTVEVLIGLDVLLQVVFHLDGPGRVFTLTF